MARRSKNLKDQKVRRISRKSIRINKKNRAGAPWGLRGGACGPWGPSGPKRASSKSPRRPKTLSFSASPNVRKKILKFPNGPGDINGFFIENLGFVGRDPPGDRAAT